MHSARSAGTSDKARTKVNQKLVDWADVLFFMERRHRDIVEQKFSLATQKLIVLDIEDNYQFGDEELIGLLKLSLSGYI